MVSAHLESTDVSSLFYSPGTERFSTVHCSLRKDLGKKKITPSRWGNRPLDLEYNIIKLFLFILLLCQEDNYLIFYLSLQLSREKDAVFFIAISSGLPVTFTIRKERYKCLSLSCQESLFHPVQLLVKIKILTFTFIAFSQQIFIEHLLCAFLSKLRLLLSATLAVEPAEVGIMSLLF